MPWIFVWSGVVMMSPTPQSPWSFSKHSTHGPQLHQFNLLYFSVCTTISLASIMLFDPGRSSTAPLQKGLFKTLSASTNLLNYQKSPSSVCFYPRVIFRHFFFFLPCYLATSEKHLLSDNHLTDSYAYHIGAEWSWLWLKVMLLCSCFRKWKLKCKRTLEHGFWVQRIEAPVACGSKTLLG